MWEILTKGAEPYNWRNRKATDVMAGIMSSRLRLRFPPGTKSGIIKAGRRCLTPVVLQRPTSDALGGHFERLYKSEKTLFQISIRKRLQHGSSLARLRTMEIENDDESDGEGNVEKLEELEGELDGVKKRRSFTGALKGMLKRGMSGILYGVPALQRKSDLAAKLEGGMAADGDSDEKHRSQNYAAIRDESTLGDTNTRMNPRGIPLRKMTKVVEEEEEEGYEINNGEQKQHQQGTSTAKYTRMLDDSED
eukprot:jgi/Bigna1/126003/aug1.1_g711